MEKKHKRVLTTPKEECDIDATLAKLKAEIQSLQPRQQHLICEWIDAWVKYLPFEASFDPKRLMRYDRGDIVFANFGYNVGSEFGGKRFAVVLEKASISRPVIAVAPMCSLKEKDPTDLPPWCVYLGEVVDGAESYVEPLHTRAISKLRIIKARKPPALAKLSADQLDKIDAVVKKYFTK